MKTVAVIPARYASSRFPGKPLAFICEKPMIQWVYETVCNVPEITKTIVATDDERICDCVRSFGGKAVMTGECSCGTDRVWEVVSEMDCDVVLNIQGDEPFIKIPMIRQLIHAFQNPNEKMAVGPYAVSNYYMETKRAQRQAMIEAKQVILDVAKKFEEMTGRKYAFFEEY